MKSVGQATRCPACQTVFRIVPDQLRVSGGWVRCGRCSEVFDATRQLISTEGSWIRLPDRSAPASAPWPSGPTPQPRQDAEAAAAEEGSLGADQDLDWQTPRLSRPSPQGLGSAPPRTDLPSATQWPERAGAAEEPDPFADEFLDNMGSQRRAPANTPGPQRSGPPQEAGSMPLGAVAADSYASTPVWVPTQGSRQAEPPAAQWQETPRESTPPPSLASARPAAPPELMPPPFLPKVEVATPPLPPARPVAKAAPPRAEPRFGDSMPAPLDAGARDFEPSLYDEPESPAVDWEVSDYDDSDPSPLAAPPAPSAKAEAPKPGFMRKAERALYWQRPHVRLLLTTGLIVATLALLLQVAMAYRHDMAARLPIFRPWLSGACAALGCTIQAARSIENLSVESSGLVRGDRSNTYKLQVSLRNGSTMALAIPPMDVTFTDSRGAVISRRVFKASELGSTIDTLPAGREVMLQAVIQTAGATPGQVSGYTVELFYP